MRGGAPRAPAASRTAPDDARGRVCRGAARKGAGPPFSSRPISADTRVVFLQEEESSEIGIAILKWTLLLGSMPIWGPFAKALWEEFKLAMRGDGGLSGPAPGPLERRRIDAELAREEPRQVHELLAHQRNAQQAAQRPTGGGRATRQAAPAQQKTPQKTQMKARGGAKPAAPTKGRGFRR